MKSRVFVAFVVIFAGLAVIAGPASGASSATAQSDRADRCSNAAVVGSGSNLTGTLESTEDLDAWKVALDEGDRLDMSALAPAAEQGFSVSLSADSSSEFTVEDVSNAETEGDVDGTDIRDVTGGLEAEWEVWAEEDTVVCLSVSDPSGDAPYEWSVNSSYRAAQYADSWTDLTSEARVVDANGSYSGHVNTPRDVDVMKLSLSEGDHLDMSALVPAAQQGFTVSVRADSSSEFTVKNVSNADQNDDLRRTDIRGLTGGLEAEWEVWAEEDTALTVVIFGGGDVPYDWRLNSTLTPSPHSDEWPEGLTEAPRVDPNATLDGHINTPRDVDVVKISLSKGDHLDMSALAPAAQRGFGVSVWADSSSEFTVKNVSNADRNDEPRRTEIGGLTGGVEAEWEVWAEEDTVIEVSVYGGGVVPYDWRLNSTLTPSPYPDEWPEGSTEAPRIEPNGTLTGHVNTPSDVDSAAVLLEQGDRLFVQTTVSAAEDSFQVSMQGINDARFRVENVSNADLDTDFGGPDITDVTGETRATWEIYAESAGAVALSLYDGGGTVPYNWTIRTSKNAPLANAAPTASFGITPTTPNASETVTFDASGSTDSDGSVTAYEWDFDGDGAVDATGEAVARTFDSAGDYDVSLTVTDDEGATDTATRTLTVTESVETNEAPTAAFTVGTTNATVGESVTFDASGAADVDGTVVSYRWDFDGDGETDAVTATAEVTHQFSASGTYAVELTVVDDDGATAATTSTVTVEAADQTPDDAVYEPGSIAAEFDSDADGRINIGELASAAEAFATGEIGISGLATIAEVFASS
jgi:PKD repeat protein